MKQTKTFKDLTKEQKKQLIVNLEESANMVDFLNELNLFFELETCQPGPITKALLANQMVNLVMPIINPNVR
tara:strand:- start:7097 stop:7312 length:216 start_codon:yes stop_codon:yes gene_type:complete